jgi:ATP-dependent helicase/nuclease subunit A
MTGRPEPPSLTGQQEAAAQPGAVSVALSAGAGCGKTTVLTERFLRMLDPERRCSLGALVALTFTDKAARELRGRVRESSRDRMSRGGDHSAHWRAIVRGLEAAPIGTFHAFCGQVLRRFPIESGVEPGFVVLEDSLAASLREQALASCVRAWLADRDADYAALAIEYGPRPLAEWLLQLMGMRSRGDLAAWAERSPEAIVAHWESFYGPCRSDTIQRHLDPAFEPVLALAPEVPAMPPVIQERMAVLYDLLPGLADCPDLDRRIEAALANARVAGTTKKGWSDPDRYEHVKQTMEQLRDALGSIRKATTWDRAATIEAARHAGCLARLTLRAIEAYDRAKREQGGLDFDDLQLRTRDLLRAKPEAVRRWLEESIGFVLVDEFQDTDPVQAEVVRGLVGDGFGTGRLFLVGDSKQSIYRFRGAQPEIFDEFRNELGLSGRLGLTENFRSVPEILDFVNALFAGTFPGPEHLLTPGAKAPPRADRQAVAFLWAEPPGPEGARGPSADARRAAEARWLARLIRSRLDDGGWVVRRKGGTTEPARAGDVVLLFRTLNDAAPYERALSDAGLDYHIVGGGAFFGQQEVLDVINLLSVLEDPHDEVALAATIRGPFGCVSDDGLYVLADPGQGGLPAGFDRWADLPGLTDTDRRRAGRLHGLLARWRTLKDQLPIAALLDRILDESGYEAALPAEYLGDRRRANLRKLVRMARSFDTRGEFTLADFVARLRADYRDPPREDQAATTDEQSDAVRLMTIHQAKGLEFPVVVLPDLNRKDNMSRGVVALHPDLGLVVRGPTDTLPGEGEDSASGESAPKNLGWLIHENRERRAEDEQSLRLFYVATTRARDFLVLSAGFTPGEKPQSTALRLLATRFDLASGSCLAELPPGCEPPRVTVITAEPPATSPAARRRRPRLLGVSRQIRRIPATDDRASDRSTPARPRFLDLDPAFGTSWLDGLMQSCLADPALFAASAERLVRQAAGRLGALVPDPVLRQARDLLSGWLDGPVAGAIREAREVRQAQRWTIAWPPGAATPCVVQGRAEFFYRDGHDRWNVVIVTCPDAPRIRERLRLLLSCQAAENVLASKPRHGWLCAPGESVQVDRFAPRDIDALLDEWLGGESRLAGGYGGPLHG